MKSILKVLGLVIASAMLTPAISAHEDHTHLAPWEEATVWPDRIVVNPGEDPSTSFSVTWRAHASVSSAIAEFVEASGDSRFDTAATSFNAKIEQVDLEKIRTAYDRIGTANYGRGMINQFSVTFKNLKPIRYMPIVCVAHGAIGVSGFRPEPRLRPGGYRFSISVMRNMVSDLMHRGYSARHYSKIREQISSSMRVISSIRVSATLNGPNGMLQKVSLQA